MLRSPFLPMLRYARRPIPFAVSRLTLVPVNGIHSSKRKQQKESRSHSYHRDPSRRPVLVASALSATATTIGGGLLLALIGYGSESVENDFMYASLQQMALVSMA